MAPHPLHLRISPSLEEKVEVVRSLKGKEKEWVSAVPEQKRPLELLDLPLDILKEIIDKLPHTNDLTSLSLCHSVLHALTISHIYSRFDIVWPDDTSSSVQRTGVDALTYGLATLVMAEENFGEAPWQRQQYQMDPGASLDPYPIPARRRGNYYAQYTKKFSLGNGPRDWVQEYLISKEGGKMLGTLVALAVSRMRVLETFIWDMPTGVLRDVWLALSSLAERGDEQECRLERVWIRWHDNSQLDNPDPNLGPIPPPPIHNNQMPPQQPPPSIAVLASVNMSTTQTVPALTAFDRVEHPTFSVLPALKSLSVLDIDELPYLDEMSVLIARSQHKLKELRIGIAPQVHQRDWVGVWDGDTLQQVDYNTNRPMESRLGEKRLGGVLGVILGRIYNMRNNADTQRTHSASSSRSIRNSIDKGITIAPQPTDSGIVQEDVPPQTPQQTHQIPETAPENNRVFIEEVLDETTPQPPRDGRESSQPEQDTETPTPAPQQEAPKTDAPATGPVISGRPIPLRSSRKHGPYLNGSLKLETLELERVPLSVLVLQKAFDWTILTSLTLLHCQDHEQLWKVLRRNYSPTSPYNSAQQAKAAGKVRLEYGLSLKKIHTNSVSPSLIAFLKETLAPNTLEVLFLQEARSYNSTVTIDQIYRGPIRRHRTSLRKLIIDSSDKADDSFGSTRWRRWMLTHEIISYITSGRMSNLRELGVALDYQHWHLFLQRLPNIAHVRSLYIPHIADHPHGANIDPRDLALQVVDIVTLRPEVELCYMGIANKCFEILESKQHSFDYSGNDIYNSGDIPGGSGGVGGGAGYAPIQDGEITDEEEEIEEDGGEEGDEDDEGLGLGFVVDEEDDEDDDGDGFGSGGVGGREQPRLRLREILFYDDKVSIFKARHGKL
ncbi:hypothetical protein EJ08DRAFT_583424 [Tothia fuscella]|uniref:F-box domain-containing protein n=1 Tax=Tothia fuscella TaxID=1048955 RepID=A0A9P4NYY9_9PEZI|nr:hypothetical protein EJ08DRAFT_583424 [Tothia fuscella]